MSGPGYATPLDATQGPKEEILYVICIQPDHSNGKSDLLATIDVDPKSLTYCQIIHRLHTGNPDDELHHSGWNVCSSCHAKKGCCGNLKRDKLILLSLGSDRIYIVDTGVDERAPKMHKIIEASEINDLNCSAPHTTHCLPSGEIMISTMGDKEGNAKGDFVLIDSKTYKTIGTWTKGKVAKFGYDFWYQPYFDVMIASEWSSPTTFKKGYQLSGGSPDDYGRSLNIYSWKRRELIQEIDLGEDGFVPLELRFLHNPLQSQGFVGCAVNANIFRFYLSESGKWNAEKVIDVLPKKVTGWISDTLQGMVSDVIISLDDKYLYFTNWFHGDVRQYDITDPKHPKLTGQVFLGGLILSDSKIKVVEDLELDSQPDPIYIKGTRLYGAPQMLQLSLDGKRLYVSSSLYSSWDRQFYPDTIKQGSFLVKLDVDVEDGGMTLDKDFFVDLKNLPDGPLLTHEIRYPGGDCTSDIWLVPESAQ